ncbi:solute carrier family 22 member 6-A-like [Pristis pectinata]|uniref:solute carrier family 22 member 6-A-like n=1 Tax=Pristis pectinata TaxID=685728 RepID=UPI00223E2B25|nr:solute carrier family 22 member 6-A-like [Pristis pectinata]XP_051900951.1 solute carrier family 22 member 6-A-like [Pristis pectinata]XP_051900952.1 solute carrier family 22 member 6-A-like [Pristis pectinata]XP_051900954.1 solute carrier family 22 member 6-A-like [Pristis pectinata]XP_051900955.1 solute carrier family 22 member 6-A-like [Pristis pectinata]XP_051900956.1 solute carrier family 22 member 6-A-like [Pristis pectinata]XP_051900957.1 solute carrier family 22 member 6-A-like [Pr
MTMGFVDILEKVGGAGRFQIIHILLLSLPITFMASHNLLQNFVAVVPGHRCRVHPGANGTRYLNVTEEPLSEELLRVFVPLDREGRPDKCLLYTSPQWQLLGTNETWGNRSQPDTQACTDGWVYDRSQFTATIVTEWDLVCDRKSLRHLAQSLYMAGFLAGSIIFGRLADRYGRRTLLLLSHLLMAVSGTCAAFSSSFSFFCFCRFLSGMAVTGIILNTLCLCVEWIPTNIRTGVSTFCGFCYSIGQLILPGIAYGIRNNRWLHLAVSAPFYLFFLYSWWFPESARWLVMNGQTDKALRHLKRVAKLNGKKEAAEELTAAILRSNMEEELTNSKRTYSVFDLFKTPVLRKTTFCTMIVWFSTSFSYYGLSVDLQGLGVDIYLIQLIFGVVDIPAKLVGLFTLTYIGRRFTQAATLILAGLVIVVNIFIPGDLQALRTALAAIGKGSLAAAFSCCFLHVSELYPTVIRQTGVGFANTMARVGAMVAPAVKLTGDRLPLLPMTIYGGVAIISGASAFCLPETLSAQLPDTIKDVENRQGKRKGARKETALQPRAQVPLMEQRV